MQYYLQGNGSMVYLFVSEKKIMNADPLISSPNNFWKTFCSLCCSTGNSHLKTFILHFHYLKSRNEKVK